MRVLLKYLNDYEEHIKNKHIINISGGKIKGLLKAAFSSISSTLKDQYKDYYYCESLPNHVLIKKGQRHDTKAGSNHALDNVISDGSTIVVNAGQALLVVENRKVIDISLEEGLYTWQTGTTPSIFTGNLPTSIKESIKDLISRITYGGEPHVIKEFIMLI